MTTTRRKTAKKTVSRPTTKSHTRHKQTARKTKSYELILVPVHLKSRKRKR